MVLFQLLCPQRYSLQSGTSWAFRYRVFVHPNPPHRNHPMISKHKRTGLAWLVEASRLYSDSGLSPMSSLRVISAQYLLALSLSRDTFINSRYASLSLRIMSSGSWRRSCIPDCVTSSQSDPLRNWSVLLLCFGELLLRSEGLVALQMLHQHLFLESMFWSRGVAGSTKDNVKVRGGEEGRAVHTGILTGCRRNRVRLVVDVLTRNLELLAEGHPKRFVQAWQLRPKAVTSRSRTIYWCLRHSGCNQ